MLLTARNNSKIICSVYAKQNVVAKAGGRLKRLHNVSTLDIT